MNIQAVNQNLNVSKANFKGNSHESSQSNGSSNSVRNKAALLAALEMLAILGLCGCKSTEPQPTTIEPMPIITQDVENPDSPLVYEQKLETIKEAVSKMCTEYGNFTDTLWENFPEIYEATKDLEGSEPEDFLNDFKMFYDSNYKTITAIAAKGEKPWENVTTASEANMLLSRVISEATTSPSWSNAGIASSLTSGTDVNDGEYDVIMQIIDGLSQNESDDVKKVAELYKSAIEAAIEKTDKKIEESSIESCLESGSEAADKAVNAYDSIRLQMDTVAASKETFDGLFALFTSSKSTEEGLEAFQEPCSTYTNTFKSLMGKCGLSFQAQNPNTVIDSQFLRSELNQVQDDIFEAMGVVLIPIDGTSMEVPPISQPFYDEIVTDDDNETLYSTEENGSAPEINQNAPAPKIN